MRNYNTMNFGIALGSNLGDRLGHLRDAIMNLQSVAPSLQLRAVAPLYETAPVECPAGSRAFYNSVIEVEGELDTLALLYRLRAIESALGRPNEHAHHAPRTVDLDVLYADDVTLHHPELSLPHPRLHLRRFVLQPLADIRPDLRLPGQAHCIRELLDRLQSDEPPLRLVARDWLPFAK